MDKHLGHVLKVSSLLPNTSVIVILMPMKSTIFSNDKHGLTGIYYEVPSEKQPPTLRGMTVEERNKQIKIHNDARIAENQRLAHVEKLKLERERA